MWKRSAPGGLSTVKCSASLPAIVHEMPSRSASLEALNVATRPWPFSANETADSPVTAVSSIAFSRVTTRSAVSVCSPSVTCTVTS